jgi:hypothetical protein
MLHFEHVQYMGQVVQYIPYDASVVSTIYESLFMQEFVRVRSSARL